MDGQGWSVLPPEDLTGFRKGHEDASFCHFSTYFVPENRTKNLSGLPDFLGLNPHLPPNY